MSEQSERNNQADQGSQASQDVQEGRENQNNQRTHNTPGSTNASATSGANHVQNVSSSQHKATFMKSPPGIRRLGGKAGEIMLSARKLFEENGVAATSIKDIAEEANLTRELIYYYFADKQAIIEAVFDDFVEDLVESAMVWNELRVFGDTRGSLAKCVEAFRRSLEYKGKPRPMYAVLDELGRRDEFRIRAVRETAGAIDEYVVTEYAAFHRIEIELVYETFCLLLYGLVGLVRMDPTISNETLMKLVQQVLRLDMMPLEQSAY